MWVKSSSAYGGDISECFCDMEMKARVEESPGRHRSGWRSRKESRWMGSREHEALGTQGKGLTREWRCGADLEDLFFMCDAVIYN